jgi:non-specific serine/threonine protein kinase
VRVRRLLVILDNCEHLVHACSALAKQLLQAGAEVKVLASSRSVLQVAGEATYAVPTLSVPDPHQAVDLGRLMQLEAVRLFVDRAAAAQPAFRLGTNNAAAVVDICYRLDGIPLAIELAAARTRALSVQAIASRLNDRFRLLVSGDQTVLPRQRTLRALIDWSHDLLPESERRLFAQLAVFAGGWTLEAAEAIATAAGDSTDVLDALTALVEKSLVVMELDSARYRMLDTVRHYALEKLEQSGDAAAARTRHLAHHLALAEAARPELAGREQGSWLAQLDLERENFLSAHAWSARAPDGDTQGLRLMHALRPYWISRGSLSVGLALAQEILARPGLQARDARRCMALFGAGQFCLFMGRHAQARANLAECLAIARETDNRSVIARVLQPLGAISLEQGDFEDARGFLEEALALAQAQGDARELAAALTTLAMLHRMQLRLELAQPLCRSALALARELGDQQSIGIALLNLAMVSIGQGDLQAAGAMLMEVTALAAQTGSLPLQQSVTDVGAGLAAAQQHWEAAATFFGHGEALRESAHLRRDPADEAFLAPLLERARLALGPQESARLEALGREQAGGGQGLQALRAWLQGAAAPADA